MGCADNFPEGSIQKVYFVSPAHSNSSPIEARFSCVRAGNGGDSAVQYATTVGGKEMIRSNAALRNNHWCDAGDGGFIQQVNFIGPNELIKYHDGREQKNERQYSEIKRQQLSRGG